MIKPGAKLGVGNTWLSPFEPRVLGGLRGKINQFTDGDGTTLTPKRQPKITRSGNSGFTPILVTPEPPPPVCIPVAFGGGGFSQDPNKNPYDIGDSVDIALVSDPTGTEPITYQWNVNGDPRSSDETFSYTVSSSDVLGKDSVSNIGHIYIWLTLSNDCGGASSSMLTLNVYDPPP